MDQATLSYGTALIILWTILSFLSMKTGFQTPVKHTNNVQLVSITDVGTLRNALKKRICYVKKRSSILNPVNCAVMNRLEPLVASADMGNMVSIMNLLPQSGLGFLPVQPVKWSLSNTRPERSLIFQYEQGNTDWYWLYITFPDQKSGFLFMLTRVDILPRCEREKSYDLGQTTIYQVSAGVSVNGKWYRNTPYTTAGVYSITDPQTFSFTDTKGAILFSHSPGKMQVNFSLPMETTDPNINPTTPNQAIVGLNCSINTNKPYYAQGGPDGCAPCIYGVGTMYFAYTQLLAAGTITVTSPILSIPPVKIQVNNGVGWMDHQWGGGEANSVLGKIVMNAVGKGAVIGGLGRYIWLNLHVSNDVQYLVYTFPKASLKAGDVVEKAACTMYSVENRDYGKTAKVTVMKTAELNGTAYPCVYKVEIDGRVYTLDGTMYGKCALVDITYNDHWSGCGDLYLGDKLIGTGFMEAMQFVPDETFQNNLWKSAGSKEMLGGWYMKQKNTAAYVICLMLLLIILAVWVYITVMLAKSVADS